MEHSSRHLRFKLQSLSRRLDDLEEATRNLQKAEDEVLDLQDKIIQAEGSNSSMLAEVEGLRKRVMKIEGKDEEVKKAEDLCRLIKEKLENEENITRELRQEIEQLQKRMSELEKLEEAFSKSKSDCSQLSLSLNEEKNMSKKLSSELELLRTRVKELESSENRLDKAEQLLTSELEKIKSLTLTFANERKRFLEREKLNEKLILELREQLEVKEKIIDQTRNESNLLERSSDQHGDRNSFKIEDTLTSKTLQRVSSEYIKQSESQTGSENEKNKHQEDNKIKELNQEIEKLKNQLKHYENLEEELRQVKEKNCELQENLISEQNKNKQITDELETLKRKAHQITEVENGVLESNDTLHNQIKNERTKNKLASTESSISRSASRDVSPQHLRSERARNSESLYKRQLSNSSSSSRKSSRSPLNDTTIGNLRKQEDKISVSSYFPSGKDFGSTQNELKKYKDQPSVLSRYPPAVQEQVSQKSWKTTTGKPAERSIKLFGEDYSSKANLKKDLSLDNGKNKDKLAEDSSFNTITANLDEEIVVPIENCSLSTTVVSEFVNHSVDVSNAQKNGNFNELRTHVNSEGIDVKPTSRERLSKYSGTSGGEDNITNNNSEQNESKKPSPTSNKEVVDPQSNQTSNTQRSYYNREKTRSKSSKPLIPEKPLILEGLDYRDTERKAKLSGLHTKTRYKEKHTLQENMRTSSFENHVPSFQRELITESFRKMSSSDGLENMEINSYTSARTRSCSPREALQSTVIIKPAIIEKDMKESMSDYRARSSSESSRSPGNVTPNRVTSSIKIYPESISSRTSIDEPTGERHTSTSNIRLSANDQVLLKNNISIPLEISINKEDIICKVSNADKTFDHKDITRTTDHRFGKEQAKRVENELESEQVTWKSHNRFETNHIDSKRGTVKSSWRKGVFGSTEELDRIDKDISETKSRRKSCFDEEKPVRLRSNDLYTRNKSSSLSSWSATPEFLSKRSQSTITATDFVSRTNTSYDSLSGYPSLSRSSIETDDTFSTRRKYTSERLSKSESTGWRQTQTPRQKGVVEERIRQLEH